MNLEHLSSKFSAVKETFNRVVSYERLIYALALVGVLENNARHNKCEDLIDGNLTYAAEYNAHGLDYSKRNELIQACVEGTLDQE